MAELGAAQLERYARHVVMEEVGADGQAALLEASVLVVGAGGLGSPVVQYLAAAGVGTLGIADDDAVERSNLQRQVVHGDADVGRNKAASAASFVEALNPDVDVETYRTRVDTDDVEALVAAYDVVVDATDDVATTYLLNDACVLAGTPLSVGSIHRFEGQATTVDGAPCYRCVFPEAPPPGQRLDCATTGVFGVLPGVIGTIQATETIKHVLGIGEGLDGRLLVFDAEELATERLPVRPDPDCPVCGQGETIDGVGAVDYSGTCAVTGAEDADAPAE